MSTCIDRAIARLEGVRASGKGYIARCPAHDDHSPSLSIREGDDGRVLLHCFAGCSFRQIIAAMGLDVSDMFPPRLPHFPSNTNAISKRNDVDRLVIYREFYIEVHILLQFIAARLDALDQSASIECRAPRNLRAEALTPWEREMIAAQRIRNAIEVLYV